MSSQLKIDANRRNAQRSTGPRTPEGKAKVATNSCTHGLRSRNAILPEEDPADFQALLDGLRDVFQPANALEDSNVRELACAEWRLRRAYYKALKELQSPAHRKDEGAKPNPAAGDLPPSTTAASARSPARRYLCPGGSRTASPLASRPASARRAASARLVELPMHAYPPEAARRAVSAAVRRSG